MKGEKVNSDMCQVSISSKRSNGVTDQSICLKDSQLQNIEIMQLQRQWLKELLTKVRLRSDGGER